MGLFFGLTMRAFCGYGLLLPAEASAYAAAVCDVLGHGSSGNAVTMLLETAAQETHLGIYRDPTPNGAGRGICQCDLIAFDDIKHRAREADVDAVRKVFGIDLRNTVHAQLDYSPLLAFIFCRLFYKLIPELFPATVAGRADYWKRYYNTAQGKGTVEEYIHNAQRFL